MPTPAIAASSRKPSTPSILLPVLKRLFVRRDAGKGCEDAEGLFVMKNTHHGA
jgi:hypothetical protein